MAKRQEIPQTPPSSPSPQPDGTDLEPNQQVVVAEQMAANRTPAEQVRDIRGKDSVGPGDQPKPAHADQTEQ